MLSCCLVAPSFIFADDDVRYEVTIEIVYNALEAKEIDRHIKTWLVNHEESCKTNIKIKKLDSQSLTSDTSGYFSFGVGNMIIDAFDSAD
jgi:hypothetical protein